MITDNARSVFRAENLKQYRKARAQGIPALDAYRWATAPAAPELDWSSDSRGNDSAVVERDGFQLRITVSPDDWGDLSYLGEFTDDPDGAIPNPEYERGRYKYFRPAYGVAERRKDLSGMGYAKGIAEQMARAQVQKDARSACEAYSVIVDVTAYREGVELGSSSVGGVDLGGDWAEARAYVEEVANDLIPEAIAEAQQALNRLFENDVYTA